jgi:hypothetical protein
MRLTHRPSSRPVGRRAGAALAVAAIAAAAVLVAAIARPASAPGQGLPAAPSCPTTHWVAVWAADPGGLLGGGLADQTLRIILTPHVGGDRLRVHISNRFGAGPVTCAGASVALRRAGAGLVPGSIRPLTFTGAAGVSVPAGGEVTSDPAAVSFPAFADLAVSL